MRFTVRVAGAGVIVVLALVSVRGQTQTASASRTAATDVTFTKNVVPILQEKCQVCHRPGSIAPMSLVTYAEAKKYANQIRSRVRARTMPPWHIDRSVGIQQFKNDRSLSDDQIDTLVRWAENGTPEGDPKDMPAPVTWPDANAWQFADKFGKPDLVVKSQPYTVQVTGEDKWWRPVVDTGLTEPRWVRAIEVKPSLAGRKVVHHALTMLEQHEEGLTALASSAVESGHRMTAGLFMEWAVGKTGQMFPEGAGKLMQPGSKIHWEVHYFGAGGEVKDDVVELGIWFYPKDYKPQSRTILTMYNAAPGSELDIPPNQTAMSQNFYVIPAPARLENFQPPMHMRGKAMEMEAIYPDGRREVLSLVSNFQWRWHVNYTYADNVAPLLPKGTVLVFTAWHDNTANNPNNPDPDQWVGWGDRTIDEMAHVWIDVTYLEDKDFQRLVAERKAKK